MRTFKFEPFEIEPIKDLDKFGSYQKIAIDGLEFQFVATTQVLIPYKIPGGNEEGLDLNTYGNFFKIIGRVIYNNRQVKLEGKLYNIDEISIVDAWNIDTDALIRKFLEECDNLNYKSHLTNSPRICL